MIKYFFPFFSIYKNVKEPLSRKTKKSFQKSLVKDIKIFLKNKKDKKCQYARE